MIAQKYYKGWMVLFALFIIYSITNGVILNTLPLFYPELIKEFDWTQDIVTRPAQLLFLVVAIFAPIAGTFIDKVSIKRLMLLGSVLIMVGFLIFSKIQSISILMMAYFIFSLGITLAGIIPSMKIISNWFLKDRGLAVGIFLVGSSIGGAIFNPVAGRLISEFGWRNGVIGLGIIASVLIFIPLLLLVKVAPDQSALLSGQQFAVIDLRDQDMNKKSVISSKEIFSSRKFYILLFITGAMWFIIVGIIQHQALFLKEVSGSISSAKVLGLFFTCSILGKIIFGKLSDRYSKRNIMFLAVCNLSLGALILTLIRSNPDTLVYAYAIVFGVGFSGTFTMIQLLIAEYFQGPVYGKILGIFTMIDTLAGVLGIMILGKMRTNNGSYDQSFIVLLVISMLAAICVPLLSQTSSND
jgi:MFS family permease